MDVHHHMATTAITELDLSSYHPSSIADKINAVPGLKPSAAFFTFLRANLVLPPSAMSSNVSTPYLEPTTTQTLTQPPSPLPPTTSSPARASSAAANDDDIPSLSLDVLSSRDDKVAALRLVADSIAQQRQQASAALIFHPLCLAILAATLAAALHFSGARRHGDIGRVLVTSSGVIMSYLLAVRYLTSPYLRLAEELRWDWLVAGGAGDGTSTGEEDVVIATRFGGEVVGALVLRLEPSPAAAHPSGGGGGRKRHHRGPSATSLRSVRGGRGVIRAWTTKMRYRGKGVGGDMLRKAVRVTRERCGRDAEVGFACSHANSVAVLPDMFNAQFKKNEIRAAKALEAVLADLERSRRRR